jgi:hypothetical protein
MRHTLFVVLAIAMAGIANGDYLITVNGELNPDPIIINVNDSLDIGLWGDGSILMGVFYLGLDVGDDAVMDISSTNILYPGISKWVEWEYDEWTTDFLNVQNPCVLVQLSDPVMPPATPRPLEGQLIENIWLSPTNAGLITLRLFDGDGSPMDSEPIDVQQIYVTSIPEPMTIALFGLGALMLKRRR